MRCIRHKCYVIFSLVTIGSLGIVLKLSGVDRVAMDTIGISIHLLGRGKFNVTKVHRETQLGKSELSQDCNIIQYTNPITGKLVRVRLTLSPRQQQSLYNMTDRRDVDHPLFHRGPVGNHGLQTRVHGTQQAQASGHDGKQARALGDLDILGIKNLTFLPRYKNPCWRDIHQTLRCLPYFYLVGAPKSGTTDLYRRLGQHPDFIEPTKKEPHWLTRNRIGPDKGKAERSLANYVLYFSKLTQALEGAKSDPLGMNDTFDRITGDCSASTLWDNTAWLHLPRNLDPLEPTYTNPDYLYKLNPNTRIIMLLRHPTSRLYSDYLYFNNDTDGETQQAHFHSSVVTSLKLFISCMERYSLRHCVYNEKLQDDMQLRLHIGIYFIYLREWYRRFPRQQILVLKAEEYSRNLRRELERVFQFLGLRPLHDEYMSAIVDAKRANVRSAAQRTLGDMWHETRRLLDTFYSQFNVHLSLLLRQYGDR